VFDLIIAEAYFMPLLSSPFCQRNLIFPIYNKKIVQNMCAINVTYTLQFNTPTFELCDHHRPMQTCEGRLDSNSHYLLFHDVQTTLQAA